MRVSALLVLSAVGFAACDSTSSLQPAHSANGATARSEPAPAGVVAAGVAGSPDVFPLYPYTRTDFAGGDDFDPVNLIFVGHADPRSIRALLLGLSGDRSAAPAPSVAGYPPVAPFNCRWHDAIGDAQIAYGGDEGWAGGVIQLACGDFGPVRFHLRLFRLGGFTVANAHFEMLIPGTADHQVLSWERAEELVAYDLLRSGLTDPVGVSVTDVINATEHRTILKDLWNALASSPEGQAVLAFVRLNFANPAPFVDADQPIRNGDGRATVIPIGSDVTATAGTTTESVPIEFGQDIPRPFCGGVPRFIHVAGHLELVKTVTVGAGGDFSSSYQTQGKLSVRDLVTGSEYFASVAEHQETQMSDEGQSVLATVERKELPSGLADNGSLQTRLKVGPAGVTQFTRRESCGR